MIIALSAVRMAVKNDVIVGGLGEHVDYDAGRFVTTARRELLQLARENEESALRVHRRRKDIIALTWRADLSSDQLADIHKLKLRRTVHRRLAAALAAVAEDDEQLTAIVREAQTAASDEVRRALRVRLLTLAIDPTDPDYRRLRAERTEMFVHVDLALLKIRADEAAGIGQSDY